MDTELKKEIDKLNKRLDNAIQFLEERKKELEKKRLKEVCEYKMIGTEPGITHENSYWKKENKKWVKVYL